MPLNGGSGGNLGFNAYYFNVSGTFFLTVEQTEMASNLCRHLLKVKRSKGIHIRLELWGYGLSLNLHLANVIYITLLGLGLIKINTALANFNNPRPSLILNN